MLISNFGGSVPFHSPLPPLLIDCRSLSLSQRNAGFIHDLLELRKNTNKATDFFCEHILPLVMGRAYRDVQTGMKTVTDVVNPSDEALALLLMENNWKVWKEMGSQAHLEKKDRPKPKEVERYTLRNQQGGSKKRGGLVPGGQGTI
jgi:hypothetical protein